MRYLIFTLIILHVSIFTFGQEDSFSMLEDANQAYINEEFVQAIELYNNILENDVESAELYYNLGNAYYKTGNINNAILFYEKALVLSPGDEDIKFNLRIVNQYVVDNIEELPQPFFIRWRESVINLFTVDTWSVISLILFVVFLIFLGFFFFGKTTAIKRLSFFAGIVAVIFSIFSLSFAYNHKNKLENRNYAIIFCPRVTVKSSPSETGTDLFLIHEGLKVEIIDNLDNWIEIRLADGNQGWMENSCIEII